MSGQLQADLLKEGIQQVSKGRTHGAIGVARRGSVVLGGHQLVVAKAEDAGVAVIHESRRPVPAEAIVDREVASLLLEDVAVAVLQLHLVAVVAALPHLLEGAAAVVDPLRTTAQAAETGIARHLFGRGDATKELLGESSGHLALAPAVIPAGALGHAAGLTGAQPKVAAIAALTEVSRQGVSGIGPVDLSSDADRGAIAVVANAAHLITDRAWVRVDQAIGLSQGSARGQ